MPKHHNFLNLSTHTTYNETNKSWGLQTLHIPPITTRDPHLLRPQIARLEAKVSAQHQDLQQVAPSVQQQVQQLLRGMPAQGELQGELQQQQRRELEAAVQAAMQPYKSMVRIAWWLLWRVASVLAVVMRCAYPPVRSPHGLCVRPLPIPPDRIAASGSGKPRGTAVLHIAQPGA